MTSALNPLACPLCGQANQCAVAAGLPAQSCWCMQQRIAPEVLERIPAAQRRQACVCPACGQSQPLSPTGTPD
ncbi:cysteine-rich CWC family protein [Comamonas sp.]|uniref:cysteine-rich CWC family protein n=1 Tax=Comamonas sp. TaxID=34028 RepID=UPI00289862B0|nr:cysteine-rich CWC family protein [Comamonas sp.]